MIVYSEESDTRYTDYGILIPIRYNKAKMVYEKLLHGVMKNAKLSDWITVPSNIPLNKDVLLLCHSERYVDVLLGSNAEDEIIRTYELINKDGSYNRYDPLKAVAPLSDLVKQNLINARACCDSAELALNTGFAYYLGGGSHHAMDDYGSGFCLVNDVVLMARYLQSQKRIKNAWIIDVDAHKGDGTAFLTKDDESIRTLSIHMKTGWPLDSPEYLSDGLYNPSWTCSDIDIGIARGEENLYVKKLKDALAEMEKRYETPEIVIVVGGVDPYEKDELDSTKDLALTKEMLLERDLLVYDFFREKRIPQVHVMAGGYGEYSWEIYVSFLENVLTGK